MIRSEKAVHDAINYLQVLLEVDYSREPRVYKDKIQVEIDTLKWVVFNNRGGVHEVVQSPSGVVRFVNRPVVNRRGSPGDVVRPKVWASSGG